VGTGKLIKNTIFGVFDSTSRVTDSVSKIGETIAMDKDYSRERDISKQRQAKHLGEGLLFGFRDLFKGIGEGVTGIVTQPVKGAMQEGVGGFFKGLGRGVVGVVAKPTVGAIDFVTRTTEGIKNTTTLFDEQKERIRYPRMLGNDYKIVSYDAKKKNQRGNIFYLQHKMENIKMKNMYIMHLLRRKDVY